MDYLYQTFRQDSVLNIFCDASTNGTGSDLKVCYGAVAVVMDNVIDSTYRINTHSTSVQAEAMAVSMGIALAIKYKHKYPMRLWYKWSLRQRCRKILRYRGRSDIRIRSGDPGCYIEDCKRQYRRSRDRFHSCAGTYPGHRSHGHVRESGKKPRSGCLCSIYRQFRSDHQSVGIHRRSVRRCGACSYLL